MKKKMTVKEIEELVNQLQRIEARNNYQVYRKGVTVTLAALGYDPYWVKYEFTYWYNYFMRASYEKYEKEQMEKL